MKLGLTRLAFGFAQVAATAAAQAGNGIEYPHLIVEMPYDPLEQLDPVSQVATAPVVVGLHPKVPARNLQKLLEYAKYDPLRLGDSARAARLAQGLHAGMVAVNNISLGLPEMPFGGARDSGYGSEGGTEALESYLVSKLVSSTHA